jgi:hypothetical protein
MLWKNILPTRVDMGQTLNAVVEERMRRMRALKEQMASSVGFEQIAKEPAYSRNGDNVTIESRHSTVSSAHTTKTTEDGRLTTNDFFTVNID